MTDTSCGSMNSIGFYSAVHGRQAFRKFRDAARSCSPFAYELAAVQGGTHGRAEGQGARSQQR